MKICFVDTYYPDALKAMPIGNGSYQEELDKVLAWQFGTADFYSREFRKLGWEAIDIIANHPGLQEKYWHEHHMHDSQIVQRQIEEFQPDVVWVQDISFWGVDQLKKLAKKCLIVAQLSCAYGNQIQKIEQFHVIFTSFPHYVEKFKNMVYMPLAFHESVLTLPAERVNDVSFVGGLGWQWKYGEKVLEAVAAEVPEARFYGYGFNKLPDSSPLKKKYCGPAWGRDMYRIYQRSKIVINRHGEIAQNYANNMRLYEATGCGAMLVTEHKDNLGDLFGDTVAEYGNTDEAVSQIQSALESGSWEEMGQNGQKQTLANHTYAHRVEKINDHIGKLWVFESADEKLVNGWQDPKIPERQYRIVVKPEIKAFRAGQPIAPYDALRRILAKIPDMNRPETTLLDVGASSAYYSEVLQIIGFQCMYTAIDYSAGFAEFANALYPDVDFRVGDATNMPFDNRSFDIVLHGGCLLHIPDMQKAVAEAARVADKYVIFHRTAIYLDDTHTRAFSKIAYDTKVWEVHRNEKEVLAAFWSNDLKLVDQTDSFIDGNFAHRTYLLKV